MKDIDYHKLQKASLISGLLTLFGFVIIIGALSFSYYEIKKKEIRLEVLSQIEKELEVKIKTQEFRIKELEIASSPKSIVTRNRNLILSGIFDNKKRQIYDYSIWLEVPILLKDKIIKVVYNFPDSSMFKKVRESAESANGYSVSYRGWGCFSNMEVNIHLKDKNIHTFSFNQCIENSPIK